MSMTIDQMIEVLTAFKAGKKIEFCCRPGVQWGGIGLPTWNFATYDYRVKQEPREFSVVVNEEGQALGVAAGYGSPVAVDPRKGSIKNCKVVRVREVMDSD